MAQTAQSMFKKIEEWASGPFIVWVFFAACFMWGIGANHFVEDTYSSFLGLQEVEEIYGLIPATWQLTYWTMSLAPQIGQIIFGYIYLSDTRANKWAGAVTAALFVMDFVADIYHRANGQVGWDARTLWAGGLTLTYFTFGSETFLTVSTGVILTTFPKAIIAFRKVAADLEKSFNNATHGRER